MRSADGLSLEPPLRPRSRQRWRRSIAAAVLAATTVSASSAQDTSVDVLRAAFLYNFVKFTEWPPDRLPPGEKLALCVADDVATGRALAHAVKGRAIEGHELTVRLVSLDDAVGSCHLLYVRTADANRSLQVLESVKGSVMLTVGDSERFALSGGIAGLFVEDDRMRFAINLKSAERARLRLSSKLLNLARIVTHDRDVRR